MTGMRRMRMGVQGMTCSSCEGHVRQALQEAGAQDVKADFRSGEALFWVAPGADPERLRSAVEAAGYRPQGIEEMEEIGTAPPSGRERDYDLVVIGSGSAAFAAAIEATARGARVGMVERGVVGGTCVNIGCIPSKALLRASELHHQAGHPSYAGLHTAAHPVGMDELIVQKEELVAQLRQKKYEDLIPEYGVDLIRGEAAFVDRSPTLRVGERLITAARYLIATGASPTVPDIPGLAGSRYLTSTSALQLDRLPGHLVVIGAGSIALELGQLYRNLGARVTLLQRHPRLLPAHEPEIAETVERALQRQGIEVVTGVAYEQVEEADGEMRVRLRVDGEARLVVGDALLVATGRTPNTAALSLERAGVAVGRRGEVVVDRFLRTGNPDIFAAGDVTGGPQFVYVAAYEGTLAAANALGEAREVELTVVPAVTFTNPAIATVGRTEREAVADGYRVKTSVLPLEAVARAAVNRDTLGVFKMVADAATDRLLGVHIVAQDAGEVIYAATLAVRFGLTVQQLRETLAPYLTMAEGMRLAAVVFGQDVSKLSCCAG